MPQIYSDIFHAMATKKNVKLEDFDTQDAIDFAFDKLQQISKQTEESTHELKVNITQAKSAVANKDEKALSDIEHNLNELEAKVKQLQTEIYTDSLTGIYNRKWLYEVFLKNEKINKNGSLAFIDINNFKTINDTYGHNNGDKVLMIIAKLLKKIQNVITIRFAGDEFIVIAEYINSQALSLLLNAVCNNLQKRPLKASGANFFISFSYGVSDFKKGDLFRDIYKKADGLMYIAKEKSRASEK